MTISEFEKVLYKKVSNNGGVFKKADFHVHMPGSSDYEYKGADAMTQLAKTINENNYAFAIVLEHERFPDVNKIEELQGLCPNTCIIPGAEINVFVDALGKKVNKDYYFHCIVAINPKQPIKDYNFLIEKAKKKFTYEGTEYPSGFKSSISDLGKYFIENDALFIPAHLHQAKAPENSRSIDDVYDDEAFLKFISLNCFSALEVRDSKTAAFFKGDAITDNGLQIPKMVCVQSSDAHHYQHVTDRKRFTWIQCQNNTFEELQSALSFAHRVSIEQPPKSYSHIIGVHISGQFIQDEWVAFNPSLNCLIGCKGSGKTSILECLRFVLGTKIPNDRKESVTKHISHILGTSGFVECLVKRDDGTNALFIRRADSPNRLRVIEYDGSVNEIENSDSNGFQAAILGWHEIEAVADDPIARINLIDQLGIEKDIKTLYDVIDQKIEHARDELPVFQRKFKSLEDKLKNRKSLRDKRNTLKKLEEGNLLNLQTEYEQFITCEQKLDNLKDRITKLIKHLQNEINNNFSNFLDDFNDPSTYPNQIQEIISGVKLNFNTLTLLQSTAENTLQGKLSEIEGNILNNIQTVKIEFAKFRQNIYDPEVNALASEDKEILTRQIQIIEETKQLPDVELECKTLEAEIKRIALLIYEICKDICDNRDKICNLRTGVVDKINQEIKTIQVRFLRSANKNNSTLFQQTHLTSKDIFSFINAYGKSDIYENLRELFLKFSNLSIDGGADWEFRSSLLDATFVDFLKLVDADDVELSLVLKNGAISPIQNLSAGQRCTTVFPLLLRIKAGPLILDQPEDNLDNRHIADVVAPEFLEKKKNQQFILTSHNANLVVLTDSDIIFHVDSDGSNGKIIKTGFFSCSSSEIKNDVLSVLDGGETALLARQKKYGINNSTIA